MLSISDVFKVDITSKPESLPDAPILPDNTGIPSTTYSGELEALNEPIPRIRMEVDEPGIPEPVFTLTPGAALSNICWKDTLGTSFTASVFTILAEPA